MPEAAVVDILVAMAVMLVTVDTAATRVADMSNIGDAMAAYTVGLAQDHFLPAINHRCFTTILTAALITAMTLPVSTIPAPLLLCHINIPARTKGSHLTP